MGWRIATPVPGIKVLQVYSTNTLGDGELTVESIGTVAWKNPGGTKGTAVELANGEQKVVTSDSDVGTIIVKRTSDTDLDTTKSTSIFCDGRECTLEKLTEVEDQISQVRQAQRTGIGDEYLQRGTLKDLMEEQRRLENKYARETGERQLFIRAQIAGT